MYGYRGEERKNLVFTGEFASWQNVLVLPRNALEQFFTPSMPALMDDAVEDGKKALKRYKEPLITLFNLC